MWKQKGVTNILTRFILVLALTAQFLDTTGAALSDKRLCADKDCKEIIAQGVGTVKYTAGEEGMVSFNINSNIRIKSKSAGSNPSLWGIEVNGREGYAPKMYIREMKKLKPDKALTFIVDVKPVNSVPILNTSEKLAEQENTIETRRTKPLNVEYSTSIENPLITSSNEKLIGTSVPVATPVQSVISDGTKDPDASVENVDDKIDLGHVLEQKPESNENSDYDKKDGVELPQKIHLNLEPTSIEATKENFKDENIADFVGQVDTFKSIPEDTEQVKVLSTNEEALQKQTISTESSNISETLTNSGEENGATVNKNQEIFEKLENATSDISETLINSLAENDAMANKNKINFDGVPLNDALNQTHESDLETIGNSSNVNTILNLQQTSTENEEYQKLSQNPNGLTEETKEIDNDENKGQTTDQATDHSTQNVTETEITLNNETISTDQNSVHLPEDETQPKSSNGNSSVQLQNDEKAVVNVNNLNTENQKYSPFFNENLLKESATSSNAEHEKPEMSSGTHKHNENTVLRTSKITEHVVSKDQIVTDSPITVSTDIHNNINITEEKVELPDNSVDNLQTSIDMQNANDVQEETTNLVGNGNIDNSNKEHQEAQTEQHNNEVPLQQSKTDNQIQSFPTETVHIPYKENLMKEQSFTEFSTSSKSNEQIKIHTKDHLLPPTKEVVSNTNTQIPEEIPTQESVVLENINPTTYNSFNDVSLNTPLPNKYDYKYQESPTTNIPPNYNYVQQSEGALPENSVEKSISIADQTTENNPNILSDTVLQPLKEKDEQMTSSPQASNDFQPKENKGLFATIMGTVNSVLSINKKNKLNELHGDRKLDELLFKNDHNKNDQSNEKISAENNLQYCKKLGANGECPEDYYSQPSTAHFHQSSTESLLNGDLTLDNFLKTLASKTLEMSELLAFLVIAAAASLFFIFGYYCFCNSSREGALLSKLNQLESSLLATHKENAILKHDLMSTRQKLASIEDCSFGSNDMVVSLKKELEEELMQKARLQEQITALQKELENAADAGIELNKIVSELLSNQTGDESIISSVEELQKQLNEQQNTIFEINASLAEKSRENSELQLLLAEQNARYNSELANLQRDNDELEQEKGNFITKLQDMKNDFDKDITAALQGKNLEIKKLQNETVDLNNKLENEHTKWQTSVAKIEALEECLKNIRKDPSVNITKVIDVANVKAQLIEAQKMYKSLKERLETELDARKLAESQLEMFSAEVEKLKQDFNQSEKDKLEAQTRLEVLSNYFKDKENQLQKELSLKEAMWLKQQGETTTTVDRVTSMQEEIQSLKSQNDSLRAEIEAQVAAHKAQIGTLENRAHETWLAARQSDRRYEESRAEATALRRQLTALAGGNVNEVNKPPAGPAGLGDELTQVPSPIHMESPGSPMLGRMPPPPFLPPPFMGPPPPFMGMPPPPPFVPPGEMRPAPLGRIMSPPPQRLVDYLDYESNNTWHRHTYSPPPATYRSLSPTDSRYNYKSDRDLISTYDTETDFSPPPSPRESRRRGANSNERIENTKISYGITKKFNTSHKGPSSSGSEKSFNSPSHDTKIKKVNPSGGGKALV